MEAPIKTEEAQENVIPTDTTTSSDQGQTSVILPMEEFAEDLDLRLGRANGNVYQRKPGIQNLHDGQIMIRLKKKRFLVIDYSIIPTASDIAAAAVTPHISCPNGAGKQKCVNPECSKVGVPVLLYDSDPDQPSSLYLRSGLCFSCQRILNEKRRTQRKRKSDLPNNGGSNQGRLSTDSAHGAAGTGMDAVYPIEPAAKRFRLNGQILDLNPDAIIINGPLEGTKHHGPGYEYREIVNELQKITHEASSETVHLANAVASMVEIPAVNAPEHTSALAMYEKSFLSMSKGIFLLSQWKSSWDAAVATAAAEKASEQAVAENAAANAILDGNAIADAVASAAAVAAAQSVSVSQDQSSSNMIPLLLAAEAKGSDGQPQHIPEQQEIQQTQGDIQQTQVDIQQAVAPEQHPPLAEAQVEPEVFGV